MAWEVLIWWVIFSISDDCQQGREKAIWNLDVFPPTELLFLACGNSSRQWFSNYPIIITSKFNHSIHHRDYITLPRMHFQWRHTWAEITCILFWWRLAAFCNSRLSVSCNSLVCSRVYFGWCYFWLLRDMNSWLELSDFIICAALPYLGICKFCL
jgi:hypothetical protein